jgi:hypothetical protein
MKTKILCIFYSCLIALTPIPVLAATLENQRFEDVVQLASRDLKLNGLGLRSVFVFKAYVAGLYLTEKSENPQIIFKNPEPKRFQIQLLRDIDAADIKKALVDGIRERSSEAQWLALQERAMLLARTIDAIGNSKKGDTIMLDYVPERGMTLNYNNVLQGNAIAGQDFYNAILSIFIGERPVDTKLKNGLMGLSN